MKNDKLKAAEAIRSMVDSGIVSFINPRTEVVTIFHFDKEDAGAKIELLRVADQLINEVDKEEAIWRGL